ncbi:MAG TPA: hypothetical protein VKM55_22145 [Candidatus Lokiarchaeia archaeon]|nr:hypothetical protein [Candidatus Lokiarchaeia archaeon]
MEAEAEVSTAAPELSEADDDDYAEYQAAQYQDGQPIRVKCFADGFEYKDHSVEHCDAMVDTIWVQPPGFPGKPEHPYCQMHGPGGYGFNMVKPENWEKYQKRDLLDARFYKPTKAAYMENKCHGHQVDDKVIAATRTERKAPTIKPAATIQAQPSAQVAPRPAAPASDSRFDELKALILSMKESNDALVQRVEALESKPASKKKQSA